MSDTAQNNNSIEDLRKALFQTLQGVRDGSVDLDKAKTINEISKTLVDSAKVEVEFLKVTGGEQSQFLGATTATTPALPPGITGVTVHRIKG